MKHLELDAEREVGRKGVVDNGVERWFKKALQRAGLSELRHSAADNPYRETGNVMLAQQLLRHESIATTQGSLHPVREDLAEALASLHKERHS